MPRKQRMYLAGVPCHVVQCGNNRDACFFSDDDCSFYLEELAGVCRWYQVLVHACVLMTNHVHLLLIQQTMEGVPSATQSVGGRGIRL